VKKQGKHIEEQRKRLQQTGIFAFEQGSVQALWPLRTMAFCGIILTGCNPVEPHHLAIFLIRKASPAAESWGMTEQIRIIPHSREGIPDTGSFEVRFPDGRPSQYFYWDDNRGRAAFTRHMSQDQARRAAVIVARTEQTAMDKTE
jgi:hypothetical protein